MKNKNYSRRQADKQRHIMPLAWLILSSPVVMCGLVLIAALQG